MNVPPPPSGEYGLRERLRSAESRLRAADTLAHAARRCLGSPDWESLEELQNALVHFDRPRLLGAPGRLLTDHRLLPAGETPTRLEEGGLRPAVPPSREVELAALRLGDAA